MTKLSIKAKIYIGSIVIAAIVTVVVSVLLNKAGLILDDFLLLLLVAIMAENYNLFDFAPNYAISAAPAIHITCIFILPPLQVATVTLVSIAIEQLIRNRKEYNSVKIIFNVSHHVLVTSVSALIVTYISNSFNINFAHADPQIFLIMLGITLVYYILDVTLVNIVIFLTTDIPFWELWKTNNRDTLLLDLTLPSLGIISVVVWRQSPIFCLLLLLPVVVNQYAQTLITRLTAQNESLDSANQELAKKRSIEQQLSKQVDELTERVSIVVKEQNRNIDNQVMAVLQVTDTASELKRISETIFQAAEEVDKSSQQTLSVVEKGTTNARRGLKTLVSSSEQARALAQSSEQLYEGARQIDQIIELITEVSDETHLLAINATIEASGAGPYGLRFSVIASEVQQLASRSRQAAQQVRDVIEQVQKSIDYSLQLSKQSLEEMVSAMQDARSIEQDLEGIVGTVKKSAALAYQIFDSIEQQRRATMQLAESVRNVSQISNSVLQDNQALLGSIRNLDLAVARLNAVNSNNVIVNSLPEIDFITSEENVLPIRK